MTRNINKELFERQTSMFQHNDEYVGEITKERVTSASSYDQGMPLRSSFVVHRPKYDINTHLDFDLGEKVDTNTNVGYNDISNDDFADLSEAMKTITRGVNPLDQCTSIINSTGAIFNKQLYNLLSSSYVVCSVAIVSLFAGLYLMSHGNIELEIKNYFGFNDKKNTQIGMLKILDTLYKTDSVHLTNIIVCDNHVQIDANAAKKYFKQYFDVLAFDKQQIKHYTNKINSSFAMKNFISDNTLGQTNVGLLMTCLISPQLFYCPDSVFSNNYQTFIKYNRKTFAYFEDKETQIVEIPFNDENIVLGLINKQNNELDIDYSKLMYCINYLKLTTLCEVTFPLIKQRFKTRYINILKKTGMTGIFCENNMLSMFPNGSEINDVIQYVDIMFSLTSANKTSKNLGQTSKKFCVKKNFEFYLRLKSLNVFILRGTYA